MLFTGLEHIKRGPKCKIPHHVEGIETQPFFGINKTVTSGSDLSNEEVLMGFDSFFVPTESLFTERSAPDTTSSIMFGLTTGRMH